MQATVKVTIRYCIWREGRPRFVPSADLRKLGFKGRDLKHDDGRWLDLMETKAWVNALLLTITDRKQKKAEGKRLRPLPQGEGYLVSNLFADMFALDPKLQSSGDVKGKVRSPHTVRFYRTMANALQDFDPELWASPAQAVSVVVAHGLYEQLAFDKQRGKGLHMARGVIACCRRAWSWGRKKGRVRENPFKDLGMEMPEGRRRAASTSEVKHLIATADSEGWPELGDMVVLAIVTSQRQADRLTMKLSQLAQGRFHFEQQKTGRMISGMVGPWLASRLEAARARRQAQKVQHPYVVINERANAPWGDDHYRHVFARIRAVAAIAMPSLADLTDQDLRDTGLTWARAGGADFERRRQLSGHSPQSAELEEKHYLAHTHSDGDEAVKAIMKTWETGE
jgi:integrase